MGTSADMITALTGHLAPDAEGYEHELLDAFDTAAAAKQREGAGS